jgi:hypothetical protein
MGPAGRAAGRDGTGLTREGAAPGFGRRRRDRLWLPEKIGRRLCERLLRKRRLTRQARA